VIRALLQLIRIQVAMVILTGCSGPAAETNGDSGKAESAGREPARGESGKAGSGRVRSGSGESATTLHPIGHEALCVTKGTIAKGSIAEPTVRAFAVGSHGDSAQLTFTYRGESDSVRGLASGQLRRQVGLKLRASDGCNLVYVMWRLDPKPKLEVSVKRNPGKRTHDECGADGYHKVKPSHGVAVPALEPGRTYVMRAEIVGDELSAWIDGTLTWHGVLPDEARELSGPAGLRTDNVRIDGIELAVLPGSAPGPACKRGEQERSDLDE
jgi:hypothetical protein